MFYKKLGKVFLGIYICFGIQISYAQNISLDPTFGTGGVKKINVNSFATKANLSNSHAAIQTDGKILLAGTIRNYNNEDIIVYRLNSDGTADISFGDNGRIILNKRTDDLLFKIMVLPNNKIMLIGSTADPGETPSLFMLELNTNGSIDSGYGQQGYIFYNHPYYEINDVKDVQQLSDGKFLFLLSYTPLGAQVLLMKTNANGTLDNNFGSGGYQGVTVSGFKSQGVSLTVLSNQEIMFSTSYEEISGLKYSAIVRLNSNGSNDNTFGTNGKLVLNNIGAISILEQSNNQLLVVGTGGAIGLFNTDGSTDNTFGTNGVVTNILNNIYLRSAIQLKNGKILAYGTSLVGSNFNCALAQFSPDGVLDNGFDSDGNVTYSIYSSSVNDKWSKELLIASDSSYFLTGQGFFSAGMSTWYFPTVRKILTNGSTDNTFGTNGQVILQNSFYNSFEMINDLVVLPDGKILQTGIIEQDGWYENNDSDIIVIKQNADGSLDNSFDGDGIKIIDVGGGKDKVYLIRNTPDGKIMIAGEATSGSYSDHMIVRLNQDGSFDNSFDGDGIKTYSVSSIYDGVSDIAFLEDGSILVAGYSQTSSIKSICLSRLLSNGSFDNSFDGDGIKILTAYPRRTPSYLKTLSDGKFLITGFDGNSYVSFFMRFQADGTVDNTFGINGSSHVSSTGMNYTGKINLLADGGFLVGGSISTGFYNDCMILKYKENGFLDSSFATDGRVIITMDSNEDHIVGMYIQPDSKILVSAYSDYKLSYTMFSMFRLNSDGSLDNTFGMAGKYNVTLGNCTSAILYDYNRILLSGHYESDIQTARVKVEDLVNSVHPFYMKNSNTSSGVVIFPNPCTNEIDIAAQDLTKYENSILEIFNSNGTTVREQNYYAASTKISTENLPEGIFYVRIRKGDQVLYAGSVFKAW